MKFNDEGLNAQLLPQLNLFKCHKVVRAGKISAQFLDGDKGLLMVDVDGIKQPFALPADFLQRHAPEIGGYLVVYEDGYVSFSPADVFEAGYHELPPLGTACGGTEIAAPAFINKTAQVPLATETQPLWSGVDLAAAGYEFTGERAVLGEEVNGEAPITFYPAPSDFSDALLWLKEGRRVARAGWNGAGQYVSLLSPYAPHPEDSPDAFPRNPYFKMWDNNAQAEGTLSPFLILKNAQNKVFPWFPSMGDLMADDWQVVA